MNPIMILEIEVVAATYLLGGPAAAGYVLCACAAWTFLSYLRVV